MEKRKIIIVDTSSSVENEARDEADSRMAISREELTGASGFLKKIWKFGIAQEYYRNKEIFKARQEITGGNGSGHIEAMMTTIERFGHEYDEVVHEGAGEKREVLGDDEASKEIKEEINGLIKNYVDNLIGEQQLEEAKNGIFARLKNAKKDSVDKGIMFADNILQIAQEVKMAVEHGEKLNSLDFDFEVVIGKAKNGVRTEAQFNAVDRITEKIVSSKIGSLVNETTIASAAALAYSSGALISKRLMNSKLAAWGTFGATTAVATAFAGMRESRRLEEERKQHARERAKGKNFTPNEAPKRKKLEEFRYDTLDANNLAGDLEAALVELEGLNGVVNESDKNIFYKVLNGLAEIDSRIEISDTQKIDLISFSSAEKVDSERLRLDIIRARAKVQLKKTSTAANDKSLLHGKDFDEIFEFAKKEKIDALVDGDRGMQKKDALFKAMKRKKIATSMAKTLAIGLTVGVVVQETGAFFDDGKEGLLETATARANSVSVPVTTNHYTVLEYLRRLATDDFPKTWQPGAMHKVLIDGHNVHLQKGVELVSVGDSYKLIHGETILADNIRFGTDGGLTKESLEILNNHHVDAGTFGIINESATQNLAVPGAEAHGLATHNVHRTLWYDNNTVSTFDKNELKLNWGGQHGTGVDNNGNYVFSIKDMAKNNSMHGKFSVDIQDAVKSGKLKMILSSSVATQNQVVEVPIDVDGNVSVNPDSEIGKMLFKTNANGHAEFLGKYAEVAEVVGDKNGVDQVRILATHIGHGVDQIKNAPVTIFAAPSEVIENEVDAPFFVPINSRLPLEAMKKSPIKERQEIKKTPINERPEIKKTLTKEQQDSFDKFANDFMREVQRLKKEEVDIEKENKYLKSRTAAEHTFFKVNNYNDLNTDNKEGADNKFLELTRLLWTEFTIHGDKIFNDKTGQWTIEKRADLDAYSCLKLLDLAGFDTKNFQYVAQGEKSESGLSLDTSNSQHGVISEDDGKRLIIDHHSEKSDRGTSAAKFVYEVLADMGLLERVEYLDKFVDFVTKCDNKNFSPAERKKILKNYSKNLYGLYYRMDVTEILELFKSLKFNPDNDLPEDYLRSHNYRHPVKGEQPLFSLSEHIKRQMKNGRESLKNLENNGLFVVDTGKDNYGKILIDLKKKSVKGRMYPRVDGENGSNQLEVFEHGYGGYLIWSPLENSFVLYTQKEMDRDLFSQGFNVRGCMWMKSSKDQQDLTITLDDILAKLSGNKDFVIDKALKSKIDVTVNAHGKNQKNVQTKTAPTTSQQPQAIDKLAKADVENALKKIRQNLGVNIQSDAVVNFDNNKDMIANLSNALNRIDRQKLTELIKSIAFWGKESKLNNDGNVIFLNNNLSADEMVNNLTSLVAMAESRQSEVTLEKKQKSNFYNNLFVKEVYTTQPEVFANLERQMDEQKVSLEAQINLLEVFAKVKLDDRFVNKLKKAKFTFEIRAQSKFSDYIGSISKVGNNEIEIDLGVDGIDDFDVSALVDDFKITLLEL